MTSHERFESYRRDITDTELELLTRYVWNMRLCEALYPTLQCLEIALRNSIHSAGSVAFGDPFWFERQAAVLAPTEQAIVQQANATLQARGKPYTVGRMVAELNFGFWTSLLNKRYEQVLWPRLLKAAFPIMPRRIRTRATLSRRLNQIRSLRNRVFHHEPVWHWHDLQQQHYEIVETIGWMSTTIRDTVQQIDRFTAVYNQGSTAYHTPLAKLIGEET